MSEKKVNILGIVTGVMLIVSLFLPWIGVANLFEITITFIKVQESLSEWYTALAWYRALVGSGVVSDILGSVHYLVGLCCLTAGLLVIGGVVSFFKGGIGGAISIIGLFSFTFFMPLQFRAVFWSGLGIGYFLGWIGSFIGIASYSYKRWKKTPTTPKTTVAPPSPTINKFCVACGAKIPMDAVFCSQCGRKQSYFGQ